MGCTATDVEWFYTQWMEFKINEILKAELYDSKKQRIAFLALLGG
jgi:iduronate 2-sulfatase